MTSHYLITTIACICIAGLAATTGVAEEDACTAQVDLKVIQVNPQTPAGAEIMAAWKAEAEKAHKATEQGSEPVGGTAAPGRTIGEKDVIFDVLACDADKLFAPVLAGEKDPAAGTLITSPRLIAYLDQESSIDIGRKVPYMVQRADGSLVVEESDDLVEGLSVKVKVSDVSQSESGDPPTCQFDMHVKMSSVTGRQPIADVPFDVGRPIISSRETVSRLRISSGTDVVIHLPQPDGDDEPVFVVVSGKIIEKQTP